MRTTGDGRPSGRFEHVPPSVRHLWSLLYRAVRRHAVGVDRLTVAVDALARNMDHLRDEFTHRARGLDEQLADLASMLGDALRVSDEREGRVLALRLRVDHLRGRVEALELRLAATTHDDGEEREPPCPELTP